MNMRLKTLILLLTIATACGSDDDETSCTPIWEVEINNPNAQVSVRNGKLHLFIPDPQTDKDVRLIQRQADYHPPGSFGTYVYFENLNNQATGTNDFDMELRVSYAYTYAPNDIIASMAIGKYGYRTKAGSYSQLFELDGPTSGYFSFGGSGSTYSVSGETDVSAGQLQRGNQPVSELQPDPKIYYMDFGVNEFVRFGRSESIEVDITNVTIAGGEFKADEFNCNSLVILE